MDHRRYGTENVALDRLAKFFYSQLFYFSFFLETRTRPYKNIFSVDLRYAGILGLWLAWNGHVTFISQWQYSNNNALYRIGSSSKSQEKQTNLFRRRPPASWRRRSLSGSPPWSRCPCRKTRPRSRTRASPTSKSAATCHDRSQSRPTKKTQP